MILGNLKHTDRIENLHPKFKQLFDYVKNTDLLLVPTGRIELDGEHLFINNVAPQCIEKEKQVLEVHHRYIDVHILLDGKETIGWKAIEDVQEEIKSFSEEEDCALYADRGTTYVDLLPGQFMIVYPEDPHAPIIGEGIIRKLIGKVEL